MKDIPDNSIHSIPTDMNPSSIPRLLRPRKVIKKRLPLLLSFCFLSLTAVLGQPIWVPGTPSIGTVGPTTISVNYGFDRTGTIYICAYNYNNEAILTSPIVKSLAMTGPSGNLVATAVLPVTAGNVNTIMTNVLDITESNRLHTIYIVAESTTGVLQATPVRLLATTLPCPKIDLLTGFTQPITCVNRGATAVFQLALVDPSTSGILKGTTWFLDWGDGTTNTYTSANDYEVPPLALRTHTYTSVNDCNYVFSNTISNPCGETRSVQYIAVVHGRDIPADGDGILRIVDNVNGSSVIQVCEGIQSFITLRDNSTWNCQNPILPGDLTAIPNVDPRNIEWLYGRDPAGSPLNTITGIVNISTLGSAPQTSGRISPTPYGPNSLSQAITIPATARAGEYFRVYLKNWNKCNWSDPEFVSTYIDIQVISSPLPQQPTLSHPDKNYICFDYCLSTYTITAVPATSSTVTSYQWYRDGMVLPDETSQSITLCRPEHSGSYTVSSIGAAPEYYQSPQSDPWDVTIHTLSNLTNPQPDTICQGQTATFSAWTTDEVQTWQWEYSMDGGENFTTVSQSVPFNGFNTPNLTITNPPTSWNGYLFRVEIKTPPGQGGCGFKSGPAKLTVNSPIVDAGPDQGICAMANATLVGSIGGSATSATWSGGAGTFTPNNTSLNAVYTPTAAERAAQSVTLTLTTNDPSGTCLPVSDQVTISIGTMPTAAVLTSSGDACFGAAASWLNIPVTGGGDPYVISYTLNGVARPNITTYYNNTHFNLGILPVGTYTYAITQIRDNCGNILSGAGINPVTFQIFQNPVANAGGDQAFCGILTANLAAVPSIGIGTWSVVSGPGTGSFSPNVNNPNAEFTASQYGSYVLRWTEVNGGTCVSTSDKAVLFERTANAGTDMNLCGTLVTTLAGNAPAVGQGTWTRISGPGTVSFTPTANTPNATATVSVYGSYVFRWTIRNSVFCSTNDDVTVGYNPAGQVNDPADMIICNGSAQNVIFTTTNTGGLTTYNWTNTNTAIGLGNDGTGNLLFTATNTGTSPVTATITVSPSFNNGSLDCPGPSQTFTITVNPTPALSSPLTIPDFCSNTVVSYYPTSFTAGTTFSWTRGSVAGITPAGPTAGTNNLNETLRNVTNMPIGVTYRYILTANGCSNIQNVMVNVRPEPMITPGQTSTICSDNTLNHHINLDNFSNPSDNITFTWPSPVLSPVNPDFTGGTARSAPSSSNITDIFVNKTGSPGTAFYTVIPIKDGCPGAPETIAVLVSSKPTLDPGLNRTVCSNTPIGLILMESSGSVLADYYNIFNVVLDAGLSADVANAVIPNSATPSDYLLNDRFLNITGVDKNVTYTVQPFHAPDCYGDPVDVVITIRPQPYIVPAQIKSVCSGVPIAREILLSPANIPAGTLFSWPAPTMSDASVQGTAGNNVPADPPGKLHINDIITNTSGAPITATYNITAVSSQGCTGSAIPVIITVNPEPVPKPISGRDRICAGETNLVYNVAPVPGSTFNWTVDPAVGTKIFDYNTNAIIINSSPADGIGNIALYEVNSYSCEGARSVLSVQVSAIAAPETITGPSEVCSYSTQTYSISSHPGAIYSWSLPAGSIINGNPSAASITVVFGNTGGTISVSEINTTGCITIHNPVTVTVRPLPSASIDSGTIICEGVNVPLDIDFTGTGPYIFTYAIDGVSQAPVVTSSDPYVLNAAQAGIYRIINITDATGCTSFGSDSAQINYFPGPTGTIAGGKLLCRDSSTLINMVFTGITPYTFTYSDGTNNITVPNYPNSVYNLRVSPSETSTYTLVNLADGNGCIGTTSGSAVITVTTPPVLTLNSTNLTCNNDWTGAVDLTVSGTGPFVYYWYGPDGFNASTEDISGLRGGLYSVVVTDAGGCFSFGNVMLTEPGPVNAQLTYSGITCLGAAEGRITISLPAGGSGSYEYTIDGGSTWRSSGDFIGLAPGTYDVRIRDAMYPVCFTVLNGALVLESSSALNAAVSTTNITCYGANDGSIIISSPSGGSGAYEFSIDGGVSWQSSGYYQSLEPGAYNIMIRDATHTACLVVLDPSLVVTEPGPLNATLSSTNVTCFGADDGTINISYPTGGYGAYQFSINGGASWQASGSFQSLMPGTYDIRIRDNVHTECSVILNPGLILTEPPVLAISSTGDINLACSGIGDGTGTFSAGGGTIPYNFVVVSNTSGATIAAPGSNSLTFSNAGAGSITVSVADHNGCSSQATINITQSGVLFPGTISANQIVCFGENPATLTEITAPTGGAEAYIYQWQQSADAIGPFINIAGATTASFTPSAGATNTLYYRRMVTSGLCSPVYSNVIEVRVNPLPVAILTGGEPICPGESSVLRVNMPTGTAPFSIEIENHGMVTGYVSGSDIVVSPAVTTIFRLLRIRDANNCEVTAPSANLIGNAIIVVNDLPSITVSPVSMTVCEFTNAAFNVDAAGTNLTYQWYVNEGSGFNAVTDGGTYSGSPTPRMEIFNTVRTMNGYVYRVVISGCGTSIISPDVILTVYTTPEMIQNPRDTSVCVGQDAIMQATAFGTSLTWQWQVNKGAGFIALVDDPNFSGSTTPMLRIRNAQASFNNWLFRATVAGICGSPVISGYSVLRVTSPEVQFVIDQATQVFEPAGNTVKFTNTTNPGTWNWLWSFGDNTTSTAMNPVHTFTNIGTYSVVLSAINSQCSDSIMHQITIVPSAPVARFDSIPSGCAPLYVALQNTSLNTEVPGTTYLWDFGDGSVSTAKNPTYTYLIPGTYRMGLTVAGPGGISMMSRVVIVKQSQTISFNPLADKVYGDPSFNLAASSGSTIDINYTCSDNSVITISGNKATIMGAGTATIYASQPGDINHCPAVTVSQTLRVAPKPIMVKADSSQSKIYGEADPVLTFSVYPELAGTENFTGSPIRDGGENTGIVYSVNQGTLNPGPNYKMKFVQGSFTISAKPVTVTPEPGQNKTYGSDDPVLEFTVNPGMVNGDVPSGSLTRMPGENTGSYQILSGSLSLGNNYSASFVPAGFTINKAPLFVTGDKKERRYLDSNPEFEISYSGFVRGEDISVLDLLPSLAALPDTLSDAGGYSITVSGGSDDNYYYVYVPGILTILKRDQSITSFNTLPKFLRTTQRFPLEATASSGLEVKFVSSDEDKATISGDVMTIEKEGAVNIIAVQEGNQNWNPAPSAYQTVVGQPTFDNITSLFSPNSDGMNDHWHIVDIEDFGSVEVKVYNRFGKLVYESSDYKNDWRGDFNGRPLPEASYYYIIKSAKKGIIKGVVNIVR